MEQKKIAPGFIVTIVIFGILYFFLVFNLARLNQTVEQNPVYRYFFVAETAY